MVNNVCFQFCFSPPVYRKSVHAGTDPEILQGMWLMGWLPIVVETGETENGNDKLYW